MSRTPQNGPIFKESLSKNLVELTLCCSLLVATSRCSAFKHYFQGKEIQLNQSHHDKAQFHTAKITNERLQFQTLQNYLD